MTEQIINYSNIQLALLGIGLTLFTVIYSFIVNYRENLMEKIHSISKGNNSPSLKQKVSFLQKNISNLKKVNIHLKAIIIISLSIFVSIHIFLDISNYVYYSHIFLEILRILFYLEILYSVLLLRRIFKFYEKNTK